MQPTGRAGWVPTELWQHGRDSLRAIARGPGFALTAVLSLALGIGSTTIFSVVHAVVMDPFPYKDADHLISISAVSPDGRANWSTYTIDEYVELSERTTAFEGLIPRDALAYVAVTLVLAGTRLAACLAPALRAAGTTPMSALRD